MALIDAWRVFTEPHPPKPGCCFGAALFALLEAVELGSRAQLAIERAVLDSGGLQETPSATTAGIIREFLASHPSISDPDPARACVLEIMKRVDTPKTAKDQIAKLEQILKVASAQGPSRGGASS